MNTLFLTGFMGAGKTTIGRALAEELSLTLFDTDELIERAMKKTVNAIFEDEGELAFREYEHKVLQNVSGQSVIVTTGGGIVTREENRQCMKKNGIIIYLHSDPDTIMERLVQDTTRPLLKGNKKEKIDQLFEARLPYYLEADYVVNTTGKSVDTVVTEITGLLIRDTRFWAS
ncbi:MAG TPA: shikimate kinase [Candidatus Angelobacter sp.]|nr:shikimate kinase [Candidatus Angelobacter sp.]